MGFGGIVAQMGLGAVAGGAQAYSDDIVARQKAEMERLREERLSELRMKEHRVNAEASAKIATDSIGANAKANAAAALANQPAAAKLRDMNATADLAIAEQNAGRTNKLAADKMQSDMKAKTAQQIEDDKTVRANRTPEQQKEIDLKIKKAEADIRGVDATANYHNAMGAAAKRNAETKAAAPAEKEAAIPLPKWTPNKGNSNIAVEAVTGAVMTTTPGKAARPAEKNLVFPDKPAVEGTPDKTTIKYEGKEITSDEFDRIYEAKVRALRSKKPTDDEKAKPAAAGAGTRETSGGISNMPQGATPETLAAEAKSFIARGANPDEVRRRYKLATGKDLL